MKRIPLLILGVTSILCSGALFHFFNDPEGPNLLVVMGMAAIVYVLSLAVYVYYPSAKLTGSKRVAAVILIQILIVTVFYFFLK